MSYYDEDGADPRTVQALADAKALAGRACGGGCGRRICGHEAVFCLVLGYKGSPRCLACIADHMREPAGELRERALRYVQHHDCFHTAWHHAGIDEGFGEVARPPCLWSEGTAVPGDAGDAVAATRQTGSAAEAGPAATWDAGGMGCGDLVLELRLRLAALEPGSTLALRATDPGAPADLPSWCSMTGHTMVRADHPDYLIRRKNA